MRHTYTVTAIMNSTGFSYTFLKRFIPHVLTPANWDGLSLGERQEALEIGAVTFAGAVYDDFIKHICQEYHRQFGLLNEMQALQAEVHEIGGYLVEVRDMLRGAAGTLNLKALSLRTGLSAGTLRNKLTKLESSDGQEYAILELRGMRLKMVKSARGEWICNALDFRNQSRKLSQANLPFWL